MSEGRKRVLLVEDDEDMRQFLEVMLDKEGFIVQSSPSGDDALRIVEGMKPDLIVMDLMMPGLGGFEVIRRLQSGPAAEIPVVVVTGRYTDPSTSQMILQEPNVVDFCEKPLNPSKFALKLHNIVDSKDGGS